MMFAHGALKAALWAHGKKPGLYSMADVLGLSTESQVSIRNGIQQNERRLLVLVRHGQSEWNLKNLFTGWRPGSDREGRRRGQGRRPQAEGAGLSFDVAFTSVLMRAQHTLDLVLDEIGQTGIPISKIWR